MCRHCVAVLLEYHRWVQPRTASRKPKPPVTDQPTNPSGTHGSPVNTASSVGRPGTDLKLSEVMAFIEWLQPAMKAIEAGQPLPDSSRLNGDVALWVNTIRSLDERRHASEESRQALETERREREAYVGRMTQQLQASMAEVKSAQSSAQHLQQELTGYKDLFVKVTEIATEVGGYDSQIQSIAGELLSKGAQLDKLANSFREVATALKTVSRSST